MTEVDVVGRSIRGLPRSEIADWVRRCLRALRRHGAVDFLPTEVSIALLGDREVKALNTRYRRRKKTTDVLTFPSDPMPEEISSDSLGDIVISVEQASRQARAARHSVATEVRYLLLHGLIHALGYDHETDQGEMNALEMAIREKVGLE